MEELLANEKKNAKQKFRNLGSRDQSIVEPKIRIIDPPLLERKTSFIERWVDQSVKFQSVAQEEINAKTEPNQEFCNNFVGKNSEELHDYTDHPPDMRQDAIELSREENIEDVKAMVKIKSDFIDNEENKEIISEMSENRHVFKDEKIIDDRHSDLDNKISGDVNKVAAGDNDRVIKDNHECRADGNYLDNEENVLEFFCDYDDSDSLVNSTEQLQENYTEMMENMECETDYFQSDYTYTDSRSRNHHKRILNKNKEADKLEMISEESLLASQMQNYESKPYSFENHGRISRKTTVMSIDSSRSDALSEISIVDSNYSVYSSSGCISLDGRLQLLVITWNMCLQYPLPLEENLKKIIYPDPVKEQTCQIVVIMIQEMSPNIKRLKVAFQSTLGPAYLLTQASVYLNNVTFIFVRREILFEMSDYQVYRKFLRPSHIPKGALLMKFSVRQTSFLFINAHFHEGIENYEKRIFEYRAVMNFISELNNIPIDSKSISHNELSKCYDFIFLCGDLNTRLHNYEDTILHNLALVEHKIKTYEDVLNDDELIDAQIEGQAFQIFEEGRINFPPTYKYDLNSKQFDTSYKKRLPAYTDRILFKSKTKNTIECLIYDSCRDLLTSDHRAVYGLFDIQLNPSHKKDELFGTGLFDRKVYEEAAKLQRDNEAPETSKKAPSSVCVLL